MLLFLSQHMIEMTHNRHLMRNLKNFEKSYVRESSFLQASRLKKVDTVVVRSLELQRLLLKEVTFKNTADPYDLHGCGCGGRGQQLRCWYCVSYDKGKSKISSPNAVNEAECKYLLQGGK